MGKIKTLEHSLKEEGYKLFNFSNTKEKDQMYKNQSGLENLFGLVLQNIQGNLENYAVLPTNILLEGSGKLKNNKDLVFYGKVTEKGKKEFEGPGSALLWYSYVFDFDEEEEIYLTNEDDFKSPTEFSDRKNSWNSILKSRGYSLEKLPLANDLPNETTEIMLDFAKGLYSFYYFAHKYCIQRRGVGSC